MNSDKGTFYDRMVTEMEWDECTNPHETQRRLELVFQNLAGDIELEGLALLDAGCGDGHFSRTASRLGARVTSLDVGLNLMRNVGQADRVVGSLLEMPLADKSFDIVLSTEVVEHTADPIEALRTIARMVRPGGYVVITTPGRAWQPVVRMATRFGLRPYRGYENFVWPHIARVTLEETGIVVDRYFGFNLLPVYHPAAQPFHDAADRAGRWLPWVFVNFAIRGRRSR